MDWLKRFKEQYDHLIWLNPEEPPRYGGYWGQSYGHIARLIDMYPLSVDGLERGMKKLLVSKYTAKGTVLLHRERSLQSILGQRGLTAGLFRPIRPPPETGRAITRDSHRSRNRP